MDSVETTAGFDAERPSQARIYDYLLGGSLNFAADRRAARELIGLVPDVPLVAQANRAFLRRAVRFLAGAGIHQFLDIGSGVPTRGNVHEIAQPLAPGSRVAYVDIDPVAVTHGRALLAGDERTTTIQEDARHPDRILGHPQVRRLFDFDRPVAILMVAVLHFIADADDPAGIVTRLCAGVAPGSYLVLSHLTAEGDGAAATAEAAGGAPAGGAPGQRSATFARPRTAAEVRRLFGGLALVEPGLVAVHRWRPDRAAPAGEDEAPRCMLAGVARTA